MAKQLKENVQKTGCNYYQKVDRHGMAQTVQLAP